MKKTIQSICAVLSVCILLGGCCIADRQPLDITSDSSLQKARNAYLTHLKQNNVERIFELYCSDAISREDNEIKIGEWLVEKTGNRQLKLTLIVKDYSHFSEDVFVIDFDEAGNAVVSEFIGYED